MTEMYNICDACGKMNRSKDSHEVQGGAVCDDCYRKIENFKSDGRVSESEKENDK